jgi:cholesterol transport system auxiliary component
MRTTRAPALHPLITCGIAALLAAGCALTSKSEPMVPRYFSPERPADVDRPSVKPTASPPVAELRLGHVSSASHLEERLVYRDSDYELGYYQERRWTEAPEQYLKRRIARVLFEERGIHQVVGGAAATLELELVAFEEIRAPKHLARVQVIIRLHDQRAVRWEETLTVDQPVPESRAGDAAGAAVEALGVALHAVVDRIADRVVTELAAVAAAAAARAAAEPTLGTSGARRP